MMSTGEVEVRVGEKPTTETFPPPAQSDQSQGQECEEDESNSLGESILDKANEVEEQLNPPQTSNNDYEALQEGEHGQGGDNNNGPFAQIGGGEDFGGPNDTYPDNRMIGGGAGGTPVRWNGPSPGGPGTQFMMRRGGGPPVQQFRGPWGPPGGGGGGHFRPMGPPHLLRQQQFGGGGGPFNGGGPRSPFPNQFGGGPLMGYGGPPAQGGPYFNGGHPLQMNGGDQNPPGALGEALGDLNESDEKDIRDLESGTFEVWVETKTDQKDEKTGEMKSYFYNAKTRITTWRKPGGGGEEHGEGERVEADGQQPSNVKIFTQEHIDRLTRVISGRKNVQHEGSSDPQCQIMDQNGQAPQQHMFQHNGPPYQNGPTPSQDPGNPNYMPLGVRQQHGPPNPRMMHPMHPMMRGQNPNNGFGGGPPHFNQHHQGGYPPWVRGPGAPFGGGPQMMTGGGHSYGMVMMGGGHPMSGNNFNPQHQQGGGMRALVAGGLKPTLIPGCAWTQHVTPDGNMFYYYNPSTGESVWEKPKQFEEMEKAANKGVGVVDTKKDDGTNMESSDKIGRDADANPENCERTNVEIKPSYDDSSSKVKIVLGGDPVGSVTTVVQKESQQPHLKTMATPVDKSKPISSTPVSGTPWCVVWTGDARTFYYNPTSKVSVWEKPLDLIHRQDVDEMLVSPEAAEKVKTGEWSSTNKDGGGASKETAAVVNGECVEENTVDDDGDTNQQITVHTIDDEEDDDIVVENSTAEKETSTSSDLQRRLALLKKNSQPPALAPNVGGSNNGIAAMEAEVRAAHERKTVPLGDRMKSFRELLSEKEISAFATWEKELHKIVFDSRYLLLTSKERKSVFEAYVKDRADEERREKRIRMKEQREAYTSLMKETVISSKISFTEFVSKFGKDDVRYKGIEKARERESLFNDFIHDLKQKERKEKEEKRRVSRKEFLSLLRECSDGKLKQTKEKNDDEESIETIKIDRHSLWTSDIRRVLGKEDRFNNVELNSQREDWFNDFISDLKEEYRIEKRLNKNKDDDDKKKNSSSSCKKDDRGDKRLRRSVSRDHGGSSAAAKQRGEKSSSRLEKRSKSPSPSLVDCHNHKSQKKKKKVKKSSKVTTDDELYSDHSDHHINSRSSHRRRRGRNDSSRSPKHSREELSKKRNGKGEVEGVSSEKRIKMDDMAEDLSYEGSESNGSKHQKLEQKEKKRKEDSSFEERKEEKKMALDVCKFEATSKSSRNEESKNGGCEDSEEEDLEMKNAEMGDGENDRQSMGEKDQQDKKEKDRQDKEEMERQRRVEASMKKREEEVKEALASHLEARDKEIEKTKQKNALSDYESLLVDMIKTSDYSWKEAKKLMKKDDRYDDISEYLDKSTRERLFDEHLDSLILKMRRDFFQMLKEKCASIGLDTPFKSAKKLIKHDVRYSGFSSSERKCEKAYCEYMHQRMEDAKVSFRELLLQTHMLDHKSYDKVLNERDNCTAPPPASSDEGDHGSHSDSSASSKSSDKQTSNSDDNDEHTSKKMRKKKKSSKKSLKSRNNQKKKAPSHLRDIINVLSNDARYLDLCKDGPSYVSKKERVALIMDYLRELKDSTPRKRERK